jgi:hypothetical protein
MTRKCRKNGFAIAVAIVSHVSLLSAINGAERLDFTSDVAPILSKYCAGCHGADEPESGLSLDSFAALQKGGERGAAIVPDRADASLLIRALSGEIEPKMPPEGEPQPTAEEIETLRAWIDAGAAGPSGSETVYPELSVPQITPATDVKRSITSVAASPDGKQLALGRYKRVELIDTQTQQVIATTAELDGKVNSVSFSRDGSQFVAASGVTGLYGTVTIFRTADVSIVKQIRCHRDTLYDAELSPDGKLLATCSYDRQIHLWDVGSGKRLRGFAGHNGAVFDLAFSADGAALASASADDTVKVWNVATGARLDTLGQPEGEQNAVAIGADSAWIVAGGGDRQLRMWKFVSHERPKINPLLYSRSAHQSPIVKIAVAPDGMRLVSASQGRELLLWETSKLTPIKRYEEQSDVVTGIAFESSGTGFYVARIDGTWQRYAIEESEGIKEIEPSLATSHEAPAAATDQATVLKRDELEPNNTPASANQVSANALAKGVISAAAASGEPDVDLFVFHARQGEKLVIETKAARQKSPLDSKLEILGADGRPVPRVLLQAVRSTYFTFRGHNSTALNDFRLHGWQDMELNEYLYANGEVVKLWLYPRGPDSGFLVYPGEKGDRYTYFGTSAITHPLNEACYIVEPHPPGTQLVPNGLPEFLVYYENDDDSRRILGADSRIAFTAPAEGDYVVRVSDTREMGGDDYRYELRIRAPRPSFKVKLSAPDLTINSGSGKEFSVEAQRRDDFEGEIRVDVAGLPPGYHASTPLVIQAGQQIAVGTITADADAPSPTPENAKSATLTARATINGAEIIKKPVPLGELKLGPKPKVLVHVLPTNSAAAASAALPTQLVIAPGDTISAIVKVERNGFDGEIKFGGDDAGRNLPHGVYVDNIGLNGMTLLAGESERTFFITAAKWVPETTRLFHLRARVEGKPTSWPVTLEVRKSAPAAKSVAQSAGN